MRAMVRDAKGTHPVQFLIQARVLRPDHGRVVVALVQGLKGVGAEEVGRWRDRGHIRVLGGGAPVTLKLRALAPVDALRHHGRLWAERGIARVLSWGRRKLVLVERGRVVRGAGLVGVRAEKMGGCWAVICLRHHDGVPVVVCAEERPVELRLVGGGWEDGKVGVGVGGGEEAVLEALLGVGGKGRGVVGLVELLGEALREVGEARLLVVQEALGVGGGEGRVVGLRGGGILGQRDREGLVLLRRVDEAKTDSDGVAIIVGCGVVVRVREAGRRRRVSVSYMRLVVGEPPAGRCRRERAPTDLGLLLVHEADALWLDSDVWHLVELVVLLSLEAGQGSLEVSLPGTVAVLGGCADASLCADGCAGRERPHLAENGVRVWGRTVRQGRRPIADEFWLFCSIVSLGAMVGRGEDGGIGGGLGGCNGSGKGVAGPSVEPTEAREADGRDGDSRQQRERRGSDRTVPRGPGRNTLPRSLCAWPLPVRPACVSIQSRWAEC